MLQFIRVFRKLTIIPLLMISLSSVLILLAGFKASTITDYNPCQTFMVFEISQIWRVVLTTFLLVATMGLYFNILRSYQASEGLFHQIFFVFSLIISSEISVLLQTEAALSIFLGVISWRFLLQIHNQTQIGILLFNASFFAGIATILFSPNIVLLFMIFLGALILRSISIREVLNLMVGFFLPFIYLGVFIYLNESPWPIKYEGIHWIFETPIGNAMEILSRSLLIGLIFLTLIGAISSFLYRTQLIVRQRNQLSILFIMWVGFLFMLLFTQQIFIIYLALIGSTFIIEFYNRIRAKLVVEIFLLVFYTFSVYYLL